MCQGKKCQANTPAGRMFGSPFTDEPASRAIREGIEEDGRRRMKSFAGELTDKDNQELAS
jgi:hypothetical protein